AAPPRVVVPTTPYMVWIPEWGVYVMDGHDIVYHQTSYYQYSNGYWWISPSYAGPWALVATPPPTIASLPPGRLHHHAVRRAYMAAQASPPTAPVIVQAPPAVIVAAPPQAVPAAPAPRRPRPLGSSSPRRVRTCRRRPRLSSSRRFPSPPPRLSRRRPRWFTAPSRQLRRSSRLLSSSHLRRSPHLLPRRPQRSPRRRP